MKIGNKIKAMRLKCGLTQQELASRTELTKGYISQLENELNSPSIATLCDILEALGSNIREFFIDVQPEKIVFNENDCFQNVTDAYTTTWLVPNAQKNEMECITVIVEPHSKTMPDNPHEGEEFGYILSGTVTLHIGKNSYVCKKGESFYFISNKNHYLENKHSTPCKLLWISSPPTF